MIMVKTFKLWYPTSEGPHLQHLEEWLHLSCVTTLNFFIEYNKIYL